MRFINIENFSPDVEWLIKSNELTSALKKATTIEEKNRIIDANESKWGELKDSLLELSFNKCWYSEAKETYSHYHVDHFRPKKAARGIDKKDNGGYWWLAFDWMNYRFSGPAANVRKRSYFHVNANRALNYADNLNLEDILFLDPIKFRDPEELAFDNEGIVRPKATDKTLRNYKRARYSIIRLNLNSPSLIDKRKDKYRNAVILLMRINKKLDLQSIVFDHGREIEIETDMRQLWSMCSKNSEFSASVKYCLKSSGFDWAKEIVEKAA